MRIQTAPPFGGSRGRSIALAICLAAGLSPAAGQGASAQDLPEPLRFPAPPPPEVSILLPVQPAWALRPIGPRGPLRPSAVRLPGDRAGDPGDPPPLGPPPLHHTRDAVLITAGVSVATFGVLLLLPEEITGWSVRDRSWDGIRDEWNDFKRHVTNPPVWDNDSWFFNYLGHPYVGMHTYLMERNHGMSPIRGFLFSSAASVTFEYVVEAWAEPPSLQDLITTSPIGSFLGELNYRLTQHLRRGGLTLPEKVIVTVVNPLHVLQHGYR